jgi:hypothetical protein
VGVRVPPYRTNDLRYIPPRVRHPESGPVSRPSRTRPVLKYLAAALPWMGFRGSGVQISASRPFKINNLRLVSHQSFSFLDPYLVPLEDSSVQEVIRGDRCATRLRYVPTKSSRSFIPRA